MGGARRFGGLVLGPGLTLRQADGCADDRLPSREYRQAQPQLTLVVRPTMQGMVKSERCEQDLSSDMAN